MHFMMNFKLVISKLALISWFVTGMVTAQQLPDLTRVTPKYLNILMNNMDEESTHTVYSKAEIGIRIHTFRDFNDTSATDTSAVFKTITEAAEYFKQSGLSFYGAGFHVHPHTGFFEIKDTIAIQQMEDLFTVNNQINVFLVEKLTLDSIEGCGLTFYPDKPGKNTIILRNSYYTPTDLARMLGHFLGLLTTCNTFGGIEMVAGDNCDKSGDFLCDTYADGGMLNLVNDKCEYMGQSTDPRGKIHVPSVANIMSEAPNRCRCVFSREQIRRMQFYYSKYRYYLR